MKNLTSIGRVFFALGFIGLGIDHFIFQDFIVGRAPDWPETLPRKQVWAYLTGVIFIGISIAIIAKKKARSAAILVAILILFWAFFRHIPAVATDSFLSGVWTRAGKALTFFGGALAIAATFPKIQSRRNIPFRRFINLKGEFIITGRICLGTFLIITGIQHFMATEFVASLIPGWFLGDAVFWTYFGGIALIAGGIGLFIPKIARLAALLSGLMIFSWFWVIHVSREIAGVADGIAVFEALATAGIAFVLAGYLSKGPPENS